MLQFITNEHSVVSPEKQILDSIEGGCRWIQIRLKEASDEDIKNLFFKIRDKAKETLTTVIINDRVELAKSLGEEGVAGVHLGREDMAPAQARLLMGPEAIIGVTAHSYEEVVANKGLDIDYVGVGPYAFTETKKNLAPELGLAGMAEIMLRLKEIHWEVPCVAVGGIRLEDVKPLLEVGMNGIAVSSAIADSGNIDETVRAFLKELPMAE